MHTFPHNRRPLNPEEIPELLRRAFDYASQSVEYSPRYNKRLMTIKRTCLECNSPKWVPVREIRSAAREGVLTGCCRPCARKVSGPSLPGQREGSANSNWKGGRRQTPQGYIMVYAPNHPAAQNRYVQEHRLVMEAHLGRYLLAKEAVHHKNGIKSDNRIENLELWSVSHGNGFRYEDLTAGELADLIVHLQGLLIAKRC